MPWSCMVVGPVNRGNVIPAIIPLPTEEHSKNCRCSAHTPNLIHRPILHQQTTPSLVDESITSMHHCKQHSADLLKLVNSKDPSCVSSMGPNLLSEARRHASIAEWQSTGIQPLVFVVCCYWLFTCGNQIFLFQIGVSVFFRTFAYNLQTTL